MVGEVAGAMTLHHLTIGNLPANLGQEPRLLAKRGGDQAFGVEPSEALPLGIWPAIVLRINRVPADGPHITMAARGAPGWVQAGAVQDRTRHLRQQGTKAQDLDLLLEDK